MILSRRRGQQADVVDTDPWLTVTEVGRLLRVSAPTVYRLVASKELRAKRIRRSIRIRRSWVAAYLRANRVTELPVTPTDGQPRPPPESRGRSPTRQGPGLAPRSLYPPLPPRGPSPP